MATWFAQAFGIALAGLAGLAVSVAWSWNLLATATHPATTVPSVVATPTVTTVVSQSFLVDAAAPLGSPRLPPAPRLKSVAVAAAPLVDTRIPPAPPTAAQVWREVAPRLDQVWGVDTLATLQLLEPFVARFPDDPVAVDKLYAARIARADELAQSGDMSAGVSELLSAEQLLPQRGEAPALLHALTASSGPG